MCTTIGASELGIAFGIFAQPVGVRSLGFFALFRLFRAVLQQ